MIPYFLPFSAMAMGKAALYSNFGSIDFKQLGLLIHHRVDTCPENWVWLAKKFTSEK